MGRLRVGFSRVDITPPVGTPMGGFAARYLPSQGVHDPLYARGLVATDGEETVGLLSVDILTPPAGLVEAVRRLTEASTGIPGVNVMLAATHTHSGPETIGLTAPTSSRAVAPYLRLLERDLAGALYMAWRRMSDAQVGVGSGSAKVGVNRRRANGVTDPEVAVVRFDNPGSRSIGALVNYACHPVVLGAGNAEFSADYPGQVCKVLDDAKGPGFTAFFLNGACGDINPVSSRGYACPGGFDDVERIGSILAWEALKVLEETGTSQEAEVRAASEVLRLPSRKPSPLEAERQVQMQRRRIEELKAKNTEENQLLAELAILKYYCKNLEEAQKPGGEETQALEVQAIRIGDAVLVGIPGEAFAEIGLQIKSGSDRRGVLVVGYANGFVGYIPTEEALREGGYEVTPTWWNKVNPQAGRLIKETAVRLLSQL
ncbi:MAG: neutral/alkaline non-lysosomal ceramidase N-terminal domain-containing protein [Candidatus Bathyarchaeia archaeon]